MTRLLLTSALTATMLAGGTVAAAAPTAPVPGPAVPAPAAVAASGGSAAAFAGTRTAQAAKYRVQVSPRSNLAGRTGVKVRITGLPKRVGVYVRLCQRVAGRPGADQCYGGSDRSGIWAVRTYPYAGPRPANTVNPARGWFRLPIAARFGTVNCAATKCMVFVRRDHQNGGDFSYDRRIGVSFR